MPALDPATIRKLATTDAPLLPALSALCLRAKAVWGYDAAFLEACRAELTLRPEELETGRIAVALSGPRITGIVQVGLAEGPGCARADLMKIFVEPEALGRGIGRMLFAHAVQEARGLGARLLEIEADPGAEPFYLRMGARRVGLAPSGSIPGRQLPLLRLDFAEGAQASSR